MLIRTFLTLMLTTALVACGGGGSGTPSSDASATPARVEITTQAVLLTETGQTKALSARVLDSTGREITASVSWESTQPGQISVNSAGQVTALGDGGGGQITARVGELKSAPLMVFHSQVPAGTLLLTDAQIVGEPEETTPDATPSINNTYRVRLSGVAAPAVGQLVMNTEAKIVVGRVRAVSTDANGVHTVTLGLVPLREALPTLRIDETIDLSQAEVIIPDAVSAQFVVVRNGSSFSFSPKQLGAALPLARAQAAVAPRVQAQGATGTRSSGPLGVCKAAIDGASGAGSLPISILPSKPFRVDLTPSLETRFTPENGLERLVVHTVPTISAGLEVKALIAFEGKVTCELELFVFKLPVSGPLALFVGGLVPVGIGAELGGKLTFADMGIGASVSAKNTIDIGVVCEPGSACTSLAQAGPIETSFTPTLNGPGLSDFRFEPSLTVYGYAKASFGSLVFNSLRFDALALKMGPALKGNFAPRSLQMADATYKSDYQLAAIIKAGADTQFEGFLNLLGAAGVAETALLDTSIALATSPAGSVSADVASFHTGDTVNFTVRLDPASRNFLGINNVNEVLLVRNDFSKAIVARASVAANQSEVSLAFTAPDAGTASEFYAFVVTGLLATDSLALELGQVSSSRYSLVGAYSKEECVNDTRTGLVWEGKTATGVRAGSNLYTNYHSSFSGTQADMDAATNTHGYVKTVNALGTCGFNDWRLPTVDELETLLDTGAPSSPKIDVNWFPNTLSFAYWATSSGAETAIAPYIDFRLGTIRFTSTRFSPGHVRLVRASR